MEIVDRDYLVAERDKCARGQKHNLLKIAQSLLDNIRTLARFVEPTKLPPDPTRQPPNSMSDQPNSVSDPRKSVSGPRNSVSGTGSRVQVKAIPTPSASNKSTVPKAHSGAWSLGKRAANLSPGNEADEPSAASGHLEASGQLDAAPIKCCVLTASQSAAQPKGSESSSLDQGSESSSLEQPKGSLAPPVAKKPRIVPPLEESPASDPPESTESTL